MPDNHVTVHQVDIVKTAEDIVKDPELYDLTFSYKVNIWEGNEGESAADILTACITGRHKRFDSSHFNRVTTSLALWHAVQKDPEKSLVFRITENTLVPELVKGTPVFNDPDTEELIFKHFEELVRKEGKDTVYIRHDNPQRLVKVLYKALDSGKILCRPYCDDDDLVTFGGIVADKAGIHATGMYTLPDKSELSKFL
ncbi:MAG: hypothetical protein GY793_04835 [Proteobacteria bacterium]|nr:hypothetical protein [Pseudomonadota bacterium]